MARSDRDRFDQLSPRDLAITLRSLHRRFGSIESRASSSKLVDVVGRVGPSGERLDDQLAEAARGAALTRSALDTALTSADPVIPAAVLDVSARVFTDQRDWTVEAAIVSIDEDAAAAAGRVEHATADDLSREVKVTGSGTSTPLAVAQQLARELIGALSVAERHVDWLEEQI